MKRYIISDASKQVDVEAHVLRYWEEELDLEIPRNEMGHRYYTEENIKLVLPELITSEEENLDYMLGLKEELNNRVLEEEAKTSEEAAKEEQEKTEEKKEDKLLVCADKKVHTPVSISEDKLQQFQVIMNNIISRALVENNPLLGQEISERVSDNVLKEMDYLMRMQDEKEEQRFKKLDETIRSYQKGRMEAAATAENTKKVRKKRKLFGKRKNKQAL